MSGPDKSSANREGSVIAERYRLLRLLGTGGMGAVYEARNEWTGRRVAVKLMHASRARDVAATQRFLREARVATQLAHPNIVEVLDMGQDGGDGDLYIVQEFLDGTDLRSVLSQRKIIPPVETLDLILPVMAALSAAHRAGVVHRDIKPENIFLTRTSDGTKITKLIDFGVAKLAVEDDSQLELTRPGSAVGTPYYMSPEQARGESEIDPQTDVWAIGAVLFEMLAGCFLFQGKNYNQLLSRILMGPVPQLAQVAPTLPASLARAVQRALERDRSVRYPNMAIFLRTLVETANFAPLAWRAETSAWLDRALGFGRASEPPEEEEDDEATEVERGELLRRAVQAADGAGSSSDPGGRVRNAARGGTPPLAVTTNPENSADWTDVSVRDSGEEVRSKGAAAASPSGAPRSALAAKVPAPVAGAKNATPPPPSAEAESVRVPRPAKTPAPRKRSDTSPSPSDAELRKPKVAARSGQTILGVGNNVQKIIEGALPATRISSVDDVGDHGPDETAPQAVHAMSQSQGPAGVAAGAPIPPATGVSIAQAIHPSMVPSVSVVPTPPMQGPVSAVPAAPIAPMPAMMGANNGMNVMGASAPYAPMPNAVHPSMTPQGPLPAGMAPYPNPNDPWRVATGMQAHGQVPPHAGAGMGVSVGPISQVSFAPHTPSALPVPAQRAKPSGNVRWIAAVVAFFVACATLGVVIAMVLLRK